MKMDRQQEKYLIEITSEDLETTIIDITVNDLDRLKTDLISLTLDDLMLVVQPEIFAEQTALSPIINIELADLGPILDIEIVDLPADLNYLTTEVYHGTSWENAQRIREEGFRIGPRSALGSGIYFSVGGAGLARNYKKGSRGCIIQAHVEWGKVAYLDEPELPAFCKGSGDNVTRAALEAGYNSFITTSKFISDKQATGIVLGLQGSYIKPPRIEVIRLITAEK